MFRPLIRTNLMKRFQHISTSTQNNNSNIEQLLHEQNKILTSIANIIGALNFSVAVVGITIALKK